MLEATVKISLIFPSTGWDWKEGWKRKEKGTWTQLPASGQPSQSHARSAQSSHYDRELPIPAFQTSKCHLPSPCTWRCPQCWACAWGPGVQCLHQNTTHSWGSTAMCLRGLQLHCCRICFFDVPISKWSRAALVGGKPELLRTFLLCLRSFIFVSSSTYAGHCNLEINWTYSVY